jgi:hypothetical protein
MTIKITHVHDDLYDAVVTPPQGRVAWRTEGPMKLDELDKKLLELGCHQTDVGDAFYEADPDWVQRSKPNG